LNNNPKKKIGKINFIKITLKTINRTENIQKHESSPCTLRDHLLHQTSTVEAPSYLNHTYNSDAKVLFTRRAYFTYCSRTMHLHPSYIEYR